MSAARGLALAEEELRAVAGDRSFERGLGYLGAVSGLERAGDKVLATVRGAQDYLVVLTIPGGRVTRPGLRGECGCPYGQEGFFCKHCVAVGLAVARGGAHVPAPRSARRLVTAAGTGARGPAPARGAAGLSSWLGSRSREELLGLVSQQLLEDEEWRQRLELRAAAAAGDLQALRERVASLLAPREEPAGGREYYGYLEGAEARRYGGRITEVREAVAALAGGGKDGATGGARTARRARGRTTGGPMRPPPWPNRLSARSRPRPGTRMIRRGRSLRPRRTWPGSTSSPARPGRPTRSGWRVSWPSASSAAMRFRSCG